MNYTSSSDYLFFRSTEETRTRKPGRKIPVNGQSPAPRTPADPTRRTPEDRKPHHEAPKSAFTKAAPPQPEPAQPAPSENTSSVSRNETLLAEDVRRISAEYSNYRKRVDRDREAVKETATREAFEKLLPVLDDISAARNYGDLQDGPFAAIANKLDATVRSLGFERINEVDVPFDPNLHEAVVMQPSDTIAADNVLQVLRDGYRSGDKTIRAAQVMVSAG